jgi:putative peptidoglycan lipid II flippase
MNSLQTEHYAENKPGQLAKDTGIIGIVTLLSRILGLVRDALIARTLGAGFYSDVFYAAFRIPNLLRRMVAEGAFTTVFVPVITGEILKSKKAATDAIGGVLTISVLFTSTLTLLGIYFSAELTNLFVPGWALNSQKSELTRNLLEVMLPYIIFVSLVSLASGILNSLGKFAIPAFNQVIFNITIICGIYLSLNIGISTIHTLSFAVLLAGLFSLLPLLAQLKSLGIPLLFCSPRKSPAVSQLFRLFFPVLFVASIYQLIAFLNLIFASMLEEGSLSWLYYADRLFQFPLGIFTLALAQALLPTLSRQALTQSIPYITTSISATLNWVNFLTIPAAAGLYFLAYPIIEVIYQGGTFTNTDTEQTSLALKAFAIGLWPISCVNILSRVFIVFKNTLLVSVISVFSIVLNLIITLMIMGPSHTDSTGIMFNAISLAQNTIGLFDFGHWGIALSGSLVGFFSLLFSFQLLRRLDVLINLRLFFLSLIKPISASAVMVGVLAIFTNMGLKSGNLLMISIPSGAISFFLVSVLIKQPQSIEVVAILKKFLLKKRESQ